MSFNQRGWIPSLTALFGIIIMVAYAYFSGRANGPHGLAEARALWEANKPADYQYVIQISCFCPEEYTQPVNVQVQNGYYFSAEGELSVSETYIAQYGSVEAIFDVIDKAYQDGADEVNVEYDPNFGVPLRFSIDPMKDALDDQMSAEITDFRISAVEGE